MGGSGKFGLVNENDGGWQMKSSTNFQARGLCSRARTCHDISSRVEHDQVKFNSADPDHLEEGATARVTCDKKCELVGAGQLDCAGGYWYRKGFDHSVENPDNLQLYKEEEHIPTCVCPEGHDEEKEKGKKDKKDKKKDKKDKKDKGKDKKKRKKSDRIKARKSS